MDALFERIRQEHNINIPQQSEEAIRQKNLLDQQQYDARRAEIANITAEVYGDEEVNIAQQDAPYLSDDYVLDLHENEIPILRELERKSRLRISIARKENLTKMASVFKDSGQLQREKRISGLKKKQREQIAQGLIQTDSIRSAQNKRQNKLLAPVIHDRSLKEECLIQLKTTKRKDVTGYERHKNALKYAKRDTSTLEMKQKDLKHLINNMVCDIKLSNTVNFDPELEDYREALGMLPVVKDYDRDLTIMTNTHVKQYRLKTEIERLESEQNNPLNENAGQEQVQQEQQQEQQSDRLSEEELASIREKLPKITALALTLKNRIQNGITVYERERMNLQALVEARVILVMDLSLNKSKYTESLIEMIDEQIREKTDFINHSRDSILNPGGVWTDFDIPENIDFSDEDLIYKIKKNISIIRTEEINHVLRTLGELNKQRKQDPTSTEPIKAAIRLLDNYEGVPASDYIIEQERKGRRGFIREYLTRNRVSNTANLQANN